MKISHSIPVLLLGLLFSLSVRAQTTYNYSVSIPAVSGCDYQVCAFVNYTTIGYKGNPPLGTSTPPQCANIAVGSSASFSITIPSGVIFQGAQFMVSGGDFFHIFSTSSEFLYENCNTLSNPITWWTALSATDFELESQNVLGGR